MVGNMPLLKKACIMYIDIIGTKFLKYHNKWSKVKKFKMHFMVYIILLCYRP